MVFGTPVEKSVGVIISVVWSRVPLVKMSQEKPAWFGWSMYSMLTSLLNDQGLRYVELESKLTLHGPFSVSNPIIDEDPGPPFIHIESGAFAGSFRDSKNQKKVLME